MEHRDYGPATVVDTRAVKVTAKAMEEKVKRAANLRKAKLAKLTGKMNHIRQLMDEGDDNILTAIETELTVEFNGLFGEFCDLNTSVKGTLHQISEEEMNKDQANWFEPKAAVFKDFAEKAKAWI